LQRDETSNTSIPTKILPIDQIISHITNAALSEKQQIALGSNDTQIHTNAESAEASRRSSTSTQNTDILTPTNPIDILDNQESMSTTSVITVLEADYHSQELKSEMTSGTIESLYESKLSTKSVQEVDALIQKNETITSAGKIFIKSFNIIL
jgi:WNK lysine deficient protein kinase